MTTSLDEARRFLNLAADDLAAFRALAALPHIRQALAFFHAQQAIEKCLKAVLSARQVFFRRTHDLEEITNPLTEAGSLRHSHWIITAGSAPTLWKCAMTIRSFRC